MICDADADPAKQFRSLQIWIRSTADTYLLGVYLMSRPSRSLWEPDGHWFFWMGRPLNSVSIFLSPCPCSIILGMFLTFSTSLSFS
jgi:hypothetical protein